MERGTVTWNIYTHLLGSDGDVEKNKVAVCPDGKDVWTLLRGKALGRARLHAVRHCVRRAQPESSPGPQGQTQM